MSLKIEITKKDKRASFGGATLFIEADVTHTAHGITNAYEVRADIRFVDGFNVELDFNEVTVTPENTNEETLTDEAILALCNDEKY